MAKTLHHSDHGWGRRYTRRRGDSHLQPPNDYGVLDHQVALPGKPVVRIPMRLIANGDDPTEIVFTLSRQPDMDDAAFDADTHAVTSDLQALKAVLER